MKFGYLLGHASGPRWGDCHFLGMRFDAKWGFKRDVGESWVMQVYDGRVHVTFGGACWLTGLWRSPTGRVFVSESARRIHIKHELAPSAASWQTEPLPAVLSGVWGLDDDLVFTWGLGPDAPAMFLWNGARWTEIASPGDIFSMHGVARDLIYAVGNNGLISRWDGERWHSVTSPTDTVLSAVFVASADEIYAVGAGRRLLRGSSSGWAELLTAPSPMFGVAKFKDAVWIGATDSGLMKLENGALIPAKPNIKAEKLEVRETLLISSPNMIVGSEDGLEFRAVPEKDFVAALGDRPPAWLK